MSGIQTPKDDAETTGSPRELQNKNQGAEVGSEIAENQTRESGMDSAEVSEAPRKKMAVLESRDNVNHFPDTSKGNLMTDDRKRKAEIDGEADEETANHCASLLMVDDCEVKLLYYNRPKNQETCGSSLASNYSDILRRDQRDSNSSTICDLTLGEMDVADTYPKPASLEANKISDHDEKNEPNESRADKSSLRLWNTNLTNKVCEFEYDARDGTAAKSHFSLTENKEAQPTLSLESVQKKPNEDLMPHVKTFGEFADASTGRGTEHFGQKEASPKGNSRRISVTVMLMKTWGEKTRPSIPTGCTSIVRSK